jgi:hypothetical protein
MANDLTDEQLRAIYAWIDAIPLSRPKKNMARDFSDGVMLAEVIAAYFPHLVEVHNYPATSNVRQKIYNYETLNAKVLKKLGWAIPRDTIEDIVNAKAGVIEGILNTLQIKMAKYREKKSSDDNLSVQREPAQQSNYRPAAEPVSAAPVQQAPAARREPSKPTAAPASHAPPRQAASQHNQHAHNNAKNVVASVDEELLLEKEQTIRDLQETVEILELKIAKLEQLVSLKDSKIQKLQNR